MGGGRIFKLYVMKTKKLFLQFFLDIVHDSFYFPPDPTQQEQKYFNYKLKELQN